MNKSFWAILIGVVIGLVGVFVLLGGKEDSTTVTFEGDAYAIQDWDHVKGEGQTGVTFIEYADFECPACGSIAPLINQLQIDFNEEVFFVFRHYPLTQIHPNAFAAHRAAESAGNQNMFWEMHDLLFNTQQNWSSQVASVSDAAGIFATFASDLGLDMDKYNQDVASQEVFDAINLHVETGNSIGVDSTPTYFLNGEELPTFSTYDELKGLVQAAVDEAKATQ